MWIYKVLLMVKLKLKLGRKHASSADKLETFECYSDVSKQSLEKQIITKLPRKTKLTYVNVAVCNRTKHKIKNKNNINYENHRQNHYEILV